MSTIFLNLVIPKNCMECEWRDAEAGGDCELMIRNPFDTYTEQYKHCPFQVISKRYSLVPVLPHGRLIDADALVADLRRQCKEVFKTDAVSPDDFWIIRDQAYNERLWTTWCESLFAYLKTAPTIIEAEEDE